ncbi:hypothetical protein DBR43_11405 [Pedobacter sp. KBW06]|uniref:hypothetical protein n=1 Tax=Pedobacter sp. KBW06 TaxID=2153359 RepID=UPI000F5B687E|nr:hypothetical protein [Pedobacter sp. KBW06]RQO71837.1 hypothetical protein DBR43_11405 [Pedobacter sp. KBW06]
MLNNNKYIKQLKYKYEIKTPKKRFLNKKSPDSRQGSCIIKNFIEKSVTALKIIHHIPLETIP